MRRLPLRVCLLVAAHLLSSPSSFAGSELMVAPISAANRVPEASNQPGSLDELLALTPDQLEQVDIARINLLCATGLKGSEHLDVEQCLARLDAWASHARNEIDRHFFHFARDPEAFKNSIAYYRMGMLGTVLAEDLGLHYNEEKERLLYDRTGQAQTNLNWDVFYEDSRDVFIHGLLMGSQHHGTCASMPFLYVAVARRLGYPVNLAARRLHLYARYEEGNGMHLNIEATEHRGFSTPADEEYRTGPFPMTDEEIRHFGWLRPLSNSEALGICLLTRSHCLRNVRAYDEEIAILEHAARYLPDTPLARRSIRAGKAQAENLKAAERWDELWIEVGETLLPTGGPRVDHFRNRKLETQLFMQRSTNLVEIEQMVGKFTDEAREYRHLLSDDPEEARHVFGSLAPSPIQRQFASLLLQPGGHRRIVLPQEQVPQEYWNEIPPALGERLRKLTTKREIIEEMRIYSVEEMNMRNLESPPGLPPSAHLHPQPTHRAAQPVVRTEDLPFDWRQRPLPPELENRLGDLASITDRSVRQRRMREEIQRYSIDHRQTEAIRNAVQARRMALDQQPLMQPPLEIIIVPLASLDRAPAQGSFPPLTTEPAGEITNTDSGKGMP